MEARFNQRLVKPNAFDQYNELFRIRHSRAVCLSFGEGVCAGTGASSSAAPTIVNATLDLPSPAGRVLALHVRRSTDVRCASTLTVRSSAICITGIARTSHVRRVSSARSAAVANTSRALDDLRPTLDVDARLTLHGVPGRCHAVDERAIGPAGRWKPLFQERPTFAKTLMEAKRAQRSYHLPPEIETFR